MNYSFEIHPDIADDITDIAFYLNDQNEGLGDDFIIAVDDTLDKIEKEISNNIFSGRKFSHFFAKTIKATPQSPSFAKHFKSYQIWYEVLEASEEVTVIAIIYSRRSIAFIQKLLSNRND